MGRETKWIKKIAEGNLKAFERLCRTYQNRIFAYLYRMLDSRECAEEVLNDVMHGIWKGAARYKGSARPSTWIFGIARHKALNRLDRRRNHVLAGEEVEPQTLVHEGFETRLIREELVRKALNRLPKEQREVVELTFYSGLSYREIAEIADCPVNTVKTRMFHAKQRLRSSLAEMA